MSPPGTVSRLIQQLPNPEAFEKLWQNYFPRLVNLARTRLRGVPRASADEEDVALSALNSFIKGFERGRFPKLSDREGLWRLLVIITVRKAIDLRAHVNCPRRGGGKVFNETDLDNPEAEEAWLAQVMDQEPTPEMGEILRGEVDHLLNRLPDPQLRSIAQLKLEGWTNGEIAQQLGCAEITVERRLRRIRQILENR
jgi:RNA polymerase sigma factor (sigma-70 family)